MSSYMYKDVYVILILVQMHAFVPVSYTTETKVIPLANDTGPTILPVGNTTNTNEDILMRNTTDDTVLPISNTDDANALPINNKIDPKDLPNSNTAGTNVPPINNTREAKDLQNTNTRDILTPAVRNTNDATGQGRIVGGGPAHRDDMYFPWQVALLYNGNYMCGGSILNEWTILTAAHCVEYGSNTYTVRVGEDDLTQDEGTEFDVGVSRIIIHPCYNVTNNLEHDIALLHLDSFLVYDPYIQPVTLSDNAFDRQSIKNTKCFVSGWGAINDWDKYPDVLHYANVTVITNPKCSRRMRKYGYYPVFFPSICTLDRKRSTCSGDSGGPMGCEDNDGNFRQIGIVSWGLNPCSKHPSVYTRVSYHRRWIDENKFTW